MRILPHQETFDQKLDKLVNLRNVYIILFGKYFKKYLVSLSWQF